MGLTDTLKRPEVAFLLGMPVGYVVIDYGKKKLGSCMKDVGQEIGKNIAVAMKAQAGIEPYQQLEKKLDNLLLELAEIKKKVYQGG
ncbi:MAG TPA: hypothetical protein VJ343_03300 [archaeon]|nr:hypothetical protein [archaeon]